MAAPPANPVSASPAKAWLRWMLAAAACKLAFVAAFIPERFPDEDRFRDQAASLRAGTGYRTNGELETSLPPGHAVALAALEATVGPGNIAPLQTALAALACGALCAAAATRGRFWGAATFVATAANPYLARLNATALSENTAFLLAAALALLTRGPPRKRTALAIGAVVAALPLTAPAMAFLAAFVGAAWGWRQRREPQLLALFALGAALVITPWQIHCVRAVGRPLPTLFTPKAWPFAQPDFLWWRSWVRGESDLLAYWDHARLAKAPHAFADDAERAAGLAAAAAGPEAFRAWAARAGAERAAARPWNLQVLMPLRRAGMLWASLSPLAVRGLGSVERPDLWRPRGETAGQRLARRTLAAAYVLWHLSFLAAVALALAAALRAAPLLPLAVALGVLLYCWASGYYAMAESRRTVPFLPLLMLAPQLGAGVRPRAGGA